MNIPSSSSFGPVDRVAIAANSIPALGSIAYVKQVVGCGVIAAVVVGSLVWGPAVVRALNQWFV